MTVLFEGRVVFEHDRTNQLFLLPDYIRGQSTGAAVLSVLVTPMFDRDTPARMRVVAQPGQEPLPGAVCNVYLSSSRHPSWLLLRANTAVDTREGNFVVTADGESTRDPMTQFQYLPDQVGQNPAHFHLRLNAVLADRFWFLSSGPVQGATMLTLRATVREDHQTRLMHIRN